MKFTYNSIKLRAFILLFSFIILLVFSITYLSLQKIKLSVFNSVDITLKSEFNLITDFMKLDDGLIDLEITEISTGGYTVPRSGHYYKLTINGNSNILFENHKNKEGLKTVISPSLVDANFDFEIKNIEYNFPENHEIYFTSIGPNSEPLRVLKKNINYNGISITVYIAETIEQSLKIVKDFNYFILIIFPISLIISVFIILGLINNLLKPIKKFSLEVSSIGHKNLDKRINHQDYDYELQNMVTSFNNMLDRIHKAFETEKIILSEASHKLKTPVAIIKSYCDITLKKDRDKNEYVETIKSIKDVTNRIINLISGILSIAKLESENITYNKMVKVNIYECINSVIEISNYLAQQKNINLEVYPLKKEEINILADKDKITEAIFNIVENSIKYNKNNGFIKINLEKSNGDINISIKDNGIGIDKEDLDKIFDKFYRVNSDKSIEGSGLGLNISKTIIEAHSGNISVNSEINKCTEFIITIPLAG